MFLRSGFFALALALLLAAGCAAEHSTTGEDHGQPAEGTEVMAEPAMTEKALEMEEPAQPAQSPTASGTALASP